MDQSGYKLLLPSMLLEYFTITKVEENQKEIVIYLEENNNLQKETPDIKIESKGFVPSVLVNDFPVRSRRLLLDIRRRRWINKETGEYIHRDLSIVADGTRMTQDLANFLKGLH